MALIEEYGYVGNVWVRQNWLERAGDTGGGHAHYHDHITLLVRGSVSVRVGDEPSKEFTAPTFIAVKKNYSHEIVALEDDTVFYCVFALRDIDGEVMDIVDVANLPNYPEGEAPPYTYPLGYDTLLARQLPPDQVFKLPSVVNRMPSGS